MTIPAYIVTQKHNRYVCGVYTRQTLQKYIALSLRLLGRQRVRGLYHVKRTHVELH